MEAFIQGQHLDPLPPVDTGKIEHGVLPVEMTGVTKEEQEAVPQTWKDLQRDLFGPPSLEAPKS